MFEKLINPDSKSKFLKIDTEFIYFEDNSKFKIINETPILFGKDSIFSEDEILNSKITTQNPKVLDKKNLKNYIRRNLLPSLCTDFNIEKRYSNLNNLLKEGSLVLIIGTGEKKSYYKNIFPNSTVITSDVHNNFQPDYIFDGHAIPFSDNCFDLVLAAQVIEHTINPWIFSKEIERVTKVDGLIQIEAPQNYPYHAEPYDFFRFTFTGLRSLFSKCEVVESVITEGNASIVAVTISNYLVNTSSIKIIRSSFLFLTRILFGWLKYLDKFQSKINRRTISNPKGYAFTFRKDMIQRNNKELLKEFYQLKK